MDHNRKKRLAQVSRELNVGFETITDCLRQHGIETDGSPNSVIEPDAYVLLERVLSQRPSEPRFRALDPEPIGEEVFISYSRKDSTIADRICAALDKVGISYFIDRQGIGGGQEFPDVLAQAIVNCRVMLFIASKDSYASKFTNGEITFAFNKKKQMLPYCIDQTEMPLGLQLMCSGTNWRNVREHPIEPVLVDDVVRLLGRTSVLTASDTTSPNYEIGDYYDKNGKEGIVFDVDRTGCHGKIMALRDLPEKLAWGLVGTATGAEDRREGMKNLLIIRQTPNWEQTYPAFARCVALGEGWYLPALDEMKQIWQNLVTLSQAAEKKDGIRLSGRYLTSSEGDECYNAWRVDFTMGGVRNSSYKDERCRVRPIAEF